MGLRLCENTNLKNNNNNKWSNKRNNLKIKRRYSNSCNLLSRLQEVIANLVCMSIFKDLLVKIFFFVFYDVKSEKDY